MPDRKLLKDGNRGFCATWMPIDSLSVVGWAMGFRRGIVDSAAVEQYDVEFSVLCHSFERGLKGSARVVAISI